MSEQTKPPEQKQPRFSRRFLRNVLIASLAVNLLVFGGLAGARWAHHKWGMGEHGRGLMGYAWSIGGERGKKMRQKIRDGRKTLDPLRAQVRAKREAVREKLGSETFDRRSIQDAMAEVSEARQKLNASRRTIFLDTLEAMTDEERAGFSKWRKRHFRRWGRHHKHHRQRGD
ncbi:MAG: periplasmic heavy metal sensor [Hyphomicrobiaceae bacterium]